MKSKYEFLIQTIKQIGRFPKGYYVGFADPVLGFETDTPQDDILNITWIMCEEFTEDIYNYDFDCLDDVLKYLNMFHFYYGEDINMVHFNNILFQESDEIKIIQTDDQLLDEIIQFDDARRYRWLKDNGYLDEQWWAFGEIKSDDIDKNIDEAMTTQLDGLTFTDGSRYPKI